MQLTSLAKGARATRCWPLIGLLVAACGGSTSEPPAVATVEVTPAAATRLVGENLQLSAAVKDAAGNILSGHALLWSSSAASVASVSSSGLVTTHAIGTAIITAAAGSKSGVSTITVIPEPIASVTVAPSNDTLLVGETVQLTATLRDASNNVVTDRTPTWVSNAPNVASVSNTGLVTGVADGVTTITASAEGKSATATIQVFGPCSTALAPSITVGQTINGSLATTDCKFNDDSYADGYGIKVATTTNVQFDMTASFDTYLILLELLSDGNLVQRSFNDDVDPDDPADPNDTVDTNSRITFTLLAGAQYFILANSFDPNVTGSYQLKVTATAAVAARQVGYTKPGKAPIQELLRAIRVP